MQDVLRDQIVAAARANGVKLAAVPQESVQAVVQAYDYTPLAAMGVDTVLEVVMLQIFAPTSEEHIQILSSPLPMKMTARVRLIKTSDNSVISSNDYSYHGKKYRYTEWSANNAERLVKALRSGYETLGQDIGDGILFYPFAGRQPQGDSASCGLMPIGTDNGVFDDLAPLLSWQSFPRDSDIAISPDDMARVNNVRYDLMIGIGGNGESPEVI